MKQNVLWQNVLAALDFMECLLDSLEITRIFFLLKMEKVSSFLTPLGN